MSMHIFHYYDILHTDLANERIGLCTMVNLNSLIGEHCTLIHTFQLLHPNTLRIIKSFLLFAREFPKFQIIPHNEGHRCV